MKLLAILAFLSVPAMSQVTAVGPVLSDSNQALTPASITITGAAGTITTKSSVTASAFFGNGAALVGVSDATKVAKAGDTMTGELDLTNVAVVLTGANGNVVSAASVTASAFFGIAASITKNLFLSSESTMTTGGGSLYISTETGASAITSAALTVTPQGNLQINAGVNAVGVSTRVISVANLQLAPFFEAKRAGAANARTDSYFYPIGPTVGTQIYGRTSQGALGTVTRQINLSSGTVDGGYLPFSNPPAAGIYYTDSVAVSTGTNLVTFNKQTYKWESGGVATPGSIATLPTAWALSVTNQSGVLSEYLNVTSTGYFGVGGISAPRYPLTVYGNTTGFPDSSGSSTVGLQGQFGLQNTSNSEALVVGFVPGADGSGATTGGVWFESPDLSNFAVRYPIFLKPLGGRVAIATTTASSGADANLSVYGIIVSSTTQGTVACNAGTPVLSAGSTDAFGSYTAGVGAVNCTYTFGTVYPKQPFCECSTNAAVPIPVSHTDATNSVICTAAAAMTGDTITYHCWGPP